MKIDGPGERNAPVTSPYQAIASDVTGDGVVQPDDAILIMRAALNPASSPISKWAFVAEGQDLSGISRQATSIDLVPSVSVVSGQSLG